MILGAIVPCVLSCGDALWPFSWNVQGGLEIPHEGLEKSSLSHLPWSRQKDDFSVQSWPESGLLYRFAIRLFLNNLKESNDYCSKR